MAGDSLRVAQVYTEFDTKGLDSTSRGINALRGKLNGIRTLLAGVVGAFTMKSVAGSFISAAKQAEDYQTSIRAVSSSIKEADATFERVRKWAAVNPIDTEEAIGAFVRLKTAAVQNSEEALTAIADISTVMHRDMREVASAVVTTEVEPLRNLGIMLDRTGKTAILESNGIRIEVNKDINSIRTGIIELMGKSFGGAMNSARDTFSGTMDTMSGMWTEFKNDIMGSGKSSGPFEKVKEALRSVRDEWEAFTKIDDYKKLIEDIQGGLVRGIDLAVSGVKKLRNGFIYAKEHADELKAVAVALVGIKISLGISDLSVQILAAIKNLRLLSASLIAFAATPAGLIASAVGVIAGIAVYSKAKKDMKELEEQTVKTEAAIEEINKEFKNASISQLQTAVRTVYTEMATAETNLRALQGRLKSLTADFSSETSMIGKRAIGVNISDLKKQINEAESGIKDIEIRKKKLYEILNTSLPESSNGSAGKDTGNTAKDDKKGKSAAELLVENMRDNMKYLNADGMSFVPVLEKWIAKSKVLSDDWKTLRDLLVEIKDNATESIISHAADERERRAIEERQYLEKFKAEEEKRNTWLSGLSWGKDQGIVKQGEYLEIVKAKFEEFRISMNLTMETFAYWPESAKQYFSAFQQGVIEKAQPAMEILQKQYENGILTMGQYKQALTALMNEYGNVPLLAQTIGEKIKASESSVLPFKDSLQAMLTDSVKSFDNLNVTITDGLVDGLARAIAYGDDFGEVLKKLGQDILYTVAKMLIMQQVMNLFSGILGFGGSSFSAAKTNSLTYLENMEARTLHTGGIVGKERFLDLLPKFHTGGLSQTEQLAVLKKGEGVFTKEQMKALGMMTSDKKSKNNDVSAQNIQVSINAIDTTSFAQALQAGHLTIESIIVNNVLRNGTIRKTLRGALA